MAIDPPPPSLHGLDGVKCAAEVKRTPHSSSFISSHQITHVERRTSPSNSIKNSLNVGTWNELSLENSSSKLFELSQNVSQYRMDVVGLAETHKPGTGAQILDNGSLFINSGRAYGYRRQGVGLVLSKVVRNSLMDDIHFLTARHFRYELPLVAEKFSRKFGARELCIASQGTLSSPTLLFLSAYSPLGNTVGTLTSLNSGSLCPY